MLRVSFALLRTTLLSDKFIRRKTFSFEKSRILKCAKKKTFFFLTLHSLFAARTGTQQHDSGAFTDCDRFYLLDRRSWVMDHSHISINRLRTINQPSMSRTFPLLHPGNPPTSNPLSFGGSECAISSLGLAHQLAPSTTHSSMFFSAFLKRRFCDLTRASHGRRCTFFG